MTRRVIVVGGGAIGLTSSTLLARSGYRVVLLEEKKIFSGASGVNLGILSLPLGVLDGFSIDYVEKALSLHNSFSREYGYSLLPSSIVVPLKYLRTILGEVLRAISSIHRLGVRFRRIENLGLSLVASSTFLIDPGEYRDTLRRRLDEAGVEVLEGVAAEEIRVEEKRVTSIETSSGEELEADIVVVAAGPWTPKLLESIDVKLDLEPIKGYTIVASTSTPIDYVIGVDPIFIRPHQHRRDIILIGGYKIKSKLDTSIVEEHIEEMLSRAEKIGIVVDKVLEVKVGLRPCLDKPITTILGAKNLVVSTGHCRHGMMLAPLAAVEVVELVKKITKSL